MAQDDWRRVEGDLRAALAARDWSRAGASVWQLRQLDEGRYFEELDHYVTQQCKAGGYTMALETEQRLEAIRQWAREMLEDASNVTIQRQRRELLRNMSGEHHDVPESLVMIHLPGARKLIPFRFGGTNTLRLERPDIQDVIWSVIQELDDESE